MKASELAQQILDLVDEHGDVDVYLEQEDWEQLCHPSVRYEEWEFWEDGVDENEDPEIAKGIIINWET